MASLSVNNKTKALLTAPSPSSSTTATFYSMNDSLYELVYTFTETFKALATITQKLEEGISVTVAARDAVRVAGEAALDWTTDVRRIKAGLLDFFADPTDPSNSKLLPDTESAKDCLAEAFEDLDNLDMDLLPTEDLRKALTLAATTIRHTLDSAVEQLEQATIVEDNGGSALAKHARETASRGIELAATIVTLAIERYTSAE